MANAVTISEEAERLDAIVQKYNFEVIDGNKGAFSKALTLARGIQALRRAFTPEVIKDFMALAGSSIGFRTDKDKDDKGYSPDVIVDCAIEALLCGAYPVGNEFNIISGRAYFTKEYFERRLREYPGFTDFVFLPDVPKIMGEKGAIIHCKGSWKLNGVATEVEEDIPVRINTGQGTDALLGKAKRKFCARIYSRISGSVHTIPDDDISEILETDALVINTEPPISNTDKLKSDLKARQKKGNPEAAPDFAKAHAKLSLLYDERGEEIDARLEQALDRALMDIDKDTGDPEVMREVIRIAAEF